MHRISGQEDTVVLAEMWANTLSDLIRCPPVEVVIVQFVRTDDLARGLEDEIRRDLAAIEASLASRNFGELDIETH